MTDDGGQLLLGLAAEIAGTLFGVLPGSPMISVTARDDGTLYAISTADEDGIPLLVSGQTVMRLELDMRLTVDSQHSRLTVEKSHYMLRPEAGGTPYFHYDYNARSHTAPRAHINVHGNRDDMTMALLGKGNSKQAKARRKAFLDQGRLPTLSAFHFPVGGPRMRPSLEDVLEVAIEEFGLDANDGYARALADSRERYRRRQLQAMVQDSPEAAAASLEELGYKIAAPSTPTEERPGWLRHI